MKIFSLPKADEEYCGINCPLGGLRLEPMAVSPTQSGVTTSSLDEDTFNHASTKYFKYLN
jgi:hypothetical protein